MPSGDYPRTLPALFRRAFATHGDEPAVSDERETRTYRQLAERSEQFASALAARDVGPGDRCVVLLPNRVEFPVVDVGIAKAGAVRLPLNPLQSRDELAYVFDDADVAAVVCGGPQVADVEAVTEGLDAVRIVVGDTAPGFDAFADVLAAAPQDVPDPDVASGDLAGHYYTGGTTGRPKGVRYTHQCLVNSLLAHLAEFGIDDRDVGVLAPPLSHSAGTFLWTSLLAGGHVHVQDGFDSTDLVSAIDEHAATWTFVVPTMLYRLLDEAALDGADLGSLERVLYGAAPMRPDRLREAIDRLGPVFEQFYGQTEVPNLITTLSRADHRRAAEAGDLDRLGSAGTPCLQSELRIVDEDGTTLPAGDVGEVVVSTPYTFDGYVENPEATAATLRDGWVWTGDVGYVDGDGYLHLLDRKGNVIVSGGLNVYSAEVERVLADHPAVAEVLVVGVPDDDWGEAVHAVVVPAESVSADDLRAFAGDALAAYKRPKSVEFVDDLPTTPLGKLDRSALRETYWTGEDRNVG
jgi:fatty-acyl-CoA synthase/long-chain acyl-CoA synthetase